ncbi:carboxypeptidase-like regulatory domain-containing protein [Antarcticibacterium arcticum]|uniref:Carboxypeptidase-like regulatory domain-containing protein n=1 Tax=Antarcticibacterium arcticum TaxID=2585771 RepID=A0A5B8YJU8_9FLAO|nr:carboxypeptidase-like regulatory domain-containing protein [Antarcticibacterium arcticum]QED38014.1 carboxypeptidase-like regulatory domain-containing protein [Antarcticibacterium arcticum]
MRSFLTIFFIALIFSSGVFAQETTALVLDSQSKQAVPFATVQYGPHSGVITNEEGKFSIGSSLSDKDSLSISSLGYFPYKLTVKDLKALKEQVIYIKPANIELKDVFLTNKNLSGKQIVERVKQRVNSNYNFDLSHKKIFYRESNVNNIRRFDLIVDKSTFPEINQDLMTNISRKVPKMSDSYKEVLGDLYGNYASQKLQVIKAANLHNPQSTAGLTELTDKLERILRENVKNNSFLKIKTGILGVKVDAKELEKEMKEEKKEVVKTDEQKEKDKQQRLKYLQSSAQTNIQGLLKSVFWNEDISLDVFEKQNKYNFEVEGYTQMDNSIVYIIAFKPKRGANFQGKMYVNTADFGVHRLDYQNLKPLKKFRLLGISTASDVYRGKMIFTRAENGKYDISYLEREKGESFGIDRPLTIIEKNKFVAGRRKQNELDMEIKINAGQVTKHQLVVYETQQVDEAQYKARKTSEPFEYKTFKLYNPDFWSGYNIIEPNAAIRAFTAAEEEKVF